MDRMAKGQARLEAMYPKMYATTTAATASTYLPIPGQWTVTGISGSSITVGEVINIDAAVALKNLHSKVCPERASDGVGRTYDQCAQDILDVIEGLRDINDMLMAELKARDE
jgi:hypothetical protein